MATQGAISVTSNLVYSVWGCRATAIALATGSQVWITADLPHCQRPHAASSLTFVSVAYGKAYASDSSGHLTELNASTGAVGWQTAGAGSTAAAVANGVVYGLVYKYSDAASHLVAVNASTGAHLANVTILSPNDGSIAVAAGHVYIPVATSISGELVAYGI